MSILSRIRARLSRALTSSPPATTEDAPAPRTLPPLDERRPLTVFIPYVPGKDADYYERLRAEQQAIADRRYPFPVRIELAVVDRSGLPVLSRDDEDAA